MISIGSSRVLQYAPVLRRAAYGSLYSEYYSTLYKHLRDVLRVLYCTGENWSTTYYSTMYSTGAVARRRESAVRVISRESRESFCGNGQLHMTATVYPSSQYAVPGTWYWSVCYAYCIDSTSTTS